MIAAMSFSLRLENALTRFKASSRLTCSRLGRSILTFSFKAFIAFVIKTSTRIVQEA
jgi:hypothetical protein